MPRIVILQIQAHVVINGLQNIMNGRVPWLPDRRVKRPTLVHGPGQNSFVYNLTPLA